MIEHFNELIFKKKKRFCHCALCCVFDQINNSENLKVMTIKSYHKYLELCYKKLFSMIVYHNKLHTHSSNTASGKSHTEVLGEMCHSELTDESEHFFRSPIFDTLAAEC